MRIARMLGAEFGRGRIDRHAANRILDLLATMGAPRMGMVIMTMMMGRIRASAHITILRFHAPVLGVPTVARSIPSAHFLVIGQVGLAHPPCGS